ncbi:hypothetical protein JCM16358_13330 [Halanaerocella petrolearia]
MPLLQSEFSKDIIILLAATIVLASLLSLLVGYLSDFYFGNLVASLIGGYGDNDLLLIVDQQQQVVAKKQIQEVIEERIPGSKLKSGISLVGRANFFIEVADKYRTRQTLLKIEDYFNEVDGLESLSLIIQPRITIRGLTGQANSFVESRVKELAGVDFTLPEGDKLEIIVSDSDRLTKLKKEIDSILQQYQVLSVRFPITSQSERILSLSKDVTASLKEEFPFSIINITATGKRDLKALVKTMTEMKSFLASYTSQVTVKLKPNFKLETGDKLILPGQEAKQIILRITKVDGNQARGLIIQGDSRQILGKKAYQFQPNKLGPTVGTIKVQNPRQELAYVVEELVELVPNLDQIFSRSETLLTQLTELNSTLQQARESLVELKLLNRQLSIYQQDLSEVDFKELKEAVTDLEENLSWLTEVARALNLIQNLLTDVIKELNQVNDQLQAVSHELPLTNPYRQELRRLQDTISELATNLQTNSEEIIGYINRYNPVLQEVIYWQEQVEIFREVLDKVDSVDQIDLESRLKQVVNPQLIEEINNLDTAALDQDLIQLQEQIDNLKQVDFQAVVGELKYIQQSLPQLKDEEITATIDLIDQYLAGKVIPGSEISLLLPAQGIDKEKVKERIQSLISQPVSFVTSQLGVITANYRAQLYRILGEVKMVLAGVTAVLITLFSLLFDQTLVINSLRLWQGEGRNWYSDLGIYYGFSIGAIMLGFIFWLADINVPYLTLWQIVLVGGFLGLVVANKADSLNPISESEYQAARALGFNYSEIMRQIVIPAGKPGILKLLNRDKTYL